MGEHPAIRASRLPAGIVSPEPVRAAFWTFGPGAHATFEGYIMAFVICEPCLGVKDRACVEVCPVVCIHEGKHGGKNGGFPDMLFINPAECIDCNLCPTECPVDAIFHEEEVPPEWEPYVALNRRFFEEGVGTG